MSDVAQEYQRLPGVTSSCLCKKSEGAVLPLLIESLKNGIDDSLHAGHVDKDDHEPRAPHPVAVLGDGFDEEVSHWDGESGCGPWLP